MSNTFVGPDRREVGRLYGRSATEIVGPLQQQSSTVAFRKVLSASQHRAVRAMAWLHILLAVALAGFAGVPGRELLLQGGTFIDFLAVIGLVVLVVLQLVAGLRTWAVMYHAGRARDPIPMQHQPGLRVAILTTIVPGKEPVEMVFATLRAMLKIRHDGPLDVWLLDEGDDPDVKARCQAIGVYHFSRRGVACWNTDEGPYRARTKHGNHNSWRADHEALYDVVAQMDPDHVPFPNFLERTLGYFNAPDTAFVVAPQVYGNLTESFVARGAAQLAYLFHGIIQRGGNGHDAPLLIGTNHLYRPSAFSQIGGYQDCIIEDHLTSMVLYTEVNPATGGNWRGVYTPDILAVGEGPATYADYFSQQKRWAYGIWEIARRHSPRVFRTMRTRTQRASFIALQLHYPTMALSWVGGVFLSSLYLIGGITVTSMPATTWAVLFTANVTVGVVFNQYLRRFNLLSHERRGIGLAGIVLDLITAPVYVAAAAAQLAGRPLVYVVTAKGSAATVDGLRTFRPHLLWAALAASSIIAGLTLGHQYPALFVWAALTFLIAMAPVAHVGTSRLTAAFARRLISSVAISSVPANRRVGEILLANGVITTEGLAMLLDLQATSDAPWQRLGELAVAHGIATADEVSMALDNFSPEGSAKDIAA